MNLLASGTLYLVQAAGCLCYTFGVHGSRLYLRLGRAGDRDLPLVVGAAPCRRAYCVDTDVSVGVYSRFPVR